MTSLLDYETITLPDGRGGYFVPPRLAVVIRLMMQLDEYGCTFNRRVRRTRNHARTVWLLQESIRRYQGRMGTP